MRRENINAIIKERNNSSSKKWSRTQQNKKNLKYVKKDSTLEFEEQKKTKIKIDFKLS